MRRAQVGRADLVQALAESGPELQERLARHLGFDIEELPQENESKEQGEVPPGASRLAPQPPPAVHSEQPYYPDDVRFW